MGGRKYPKRYKHLHKKAQSGAKMRVGVSLMLLVLGYQAKSELQIPSCPQGTQECINNEDHARAYVDLLHYEFVKRYYKASLAEWAYATNITDETAKVKEDVNLEYSKYAKKRVENTQDFRLGIIQGQGPEKISQILLHTGI